MICVLGNSHAPTTLREAARANGIPVTDNMEEADLVFVSEDTPTDSMGQRDVTQIRNLVIATADATKAPVVLSSQVPPGFCRNLQIPGLIHMAETLRIKDAEHRARFPEQFILGVMDPIDYVMPLAAFNYFYGRYSVPVHVMSYEEAEFSKIAINMFLAAQVDTTNKLAKAAKKVGASWKPIAEVLKCDKRIGKHAYLEPGRWEDSRHLLRDSLTLGMILAR